MRSNANSPASGPEQTLPQNNFGDAQWGLIHLTMAVDQDEPDSGSPLRFRLDPGSGVPTYLQLVQQVEQGVRLGYLKVGDQLPKVRDAVADLAINPNTVLKAYRELEHRGLTTGRPGQGTFIAAVPHSATLREITELRRELVAWIAKADGSGLDDGAMSALFASSVRDYRGAVPPSERGRDTGTRTA